MPDTARGEVWLVDLGMAAKVRPCVVVSVPFADEDRALERVPIGVYWLARRFDIRLIMAM